MSDVLRWSQRVIALADGDLSKGNFISGIRDIWLLRLPGPAATMLPPGLW